MMRRPKKWAKRIGEWRMKIEDGREFRAVEDEEGNEVRKGATILEKDEEYNEAMQQWEAEKLEILETERQILDAEEEEGLKQKYGEEQSQEWSSMSEAAVPGGATDAATLVQKRPFWRPPCSNICSCICNHCFLESSVPLEHFQHGLQLLLPPQAIDHGDSHATAGAAAPKGGFGGDAIAADRRGARIAATVGQSRKFVLAAEQRDGVVLRVARSSSG